MPTARLWHGCDAGDGAKGALVIVYRGPSQIDGAPIVAILTRGDSNPGTGPMLQLWILRSDVHPVEAMHSGCDESVCGDCAQRSFNGGGCYCNARPLLTIWRTFQSGGYDAPRNVGTIRGLLSAGFPVRLGAYGDPAAVPLDVLSDLVRSTVGGWTGYTHQWRADYAQDYREIVMASCDGPAEVDEARAAGWRVFAVTDGTPIEGLIRCPKNGLDVTCLTCRICDGARGNDRRASVWTTVHGAKASRYRFALPVVK